MRHAVGIYSAAPRLDPALVEAIAKLDDPSLPVAETYRRLREAAAHLGSPRPSYEAVRLQVRIARRATAKRKAKRAEAVHLSMRARHVEALRELLSEL